MPYLNIKICAPQSQATTEKIVTSLMQHTMATLGKRKEVIAIGVEYIPDTQWYIGGQTQQAQGLATFHLDIKITDGTNTKNEKAEYAQRVYADMESVLGELNPASYIVIDDVRADAWGFGGETQEYRYIKGKVL